MNVERESFMSSSPTRKIRREGDQKVAIGKISLADVAKSLTVAAYATRLLLEIAFHLWGC